MSILGGIFMQVHTLHHNKQKLPSSLQCVVTFNALVCNHFQCFSADLPSLPTALLLHKYTCRNKRVLAEFVPAKSSHPSANVNHYIPLQNDTYNCMSLN